MPAEELGLAVIVAGFNKFMSDMKGMDTAIDSTGKAWESLGGVAGTNMAEVGRAMSQMGTATQKTLSQMQPLGLAMGAVSVAGTGLIASSTMVAARTETMGIVLETVGRNAGYSAEQLREYEAAVRGQGITTLAARQSLVQMAQAHIDLAHGADLARLAQDAAVIAGMNSSQAFETLITVIQRGSPVMARTMGLNVDFMGSYERLAEQLGITTEALTSDQKMQARLNEVMAQGVTIAGTYDAAMGTAGKSMTSITRHIEEARAALGEAYLPALNKAVVSTTDLLKAFNSLEPAQKRAVAGFLGIGTAVTALGSAAILVGPKIITLFQSLGPLVTLISDTGFAMQLLGAGASTSGLGLAGFAAQAIAVVAPLAAMYAAMVALDSAYQPHIDNVIATTESYHAYATNMAYAGREAEILTEAEWRLASSAEKIGETTAILADGWNSQYSPALTNARTLTDGWTGSLALATTGTEALTTAEQGQTASLDLLTSSLANASEVERALALQMGETTLLAQTQEEAMSLLAYAYDTGTLSEEDYIAAGLEVLAVNEDSIPGYEDVQEAVENATGGMYGLVASAEAIPGSMRGVVTAAREASAAAEEMAERQQKAWESFASSVQGAVGSALAAYREGNAEMLAEQQRALAEMLWNQTDTMAAMGQITTDQAIGMKSVIADEYGVMVSDTELATSQLLGLYGDWAAGGETSADDIVGFIQNIGEETEALVGAEEEHIQTMIDQWQAMQEGVGTESETIAGHYAKMGDEFGALAGKTETDAALVMSEMDDVAVSAGLMSDGAMESFDGVAVASGTMAGEIVAATGIAMGGLTELSGAIEGLPPYTKIIIEVEVIGDEPGLPQSPQLGYYYMYQDLLQLIRDNPLEIEVLFDIGAGLGGLGAMAIKRMMDPFKESYDEALSYYEETQKASSNMAKELERLSKLEARKTSLWIARADAEEKLQAMISGIRGMKRVGPKWEYFQQQLTLQQQITAQARLAYQEAEDAGGLALRLQEEMIQYGEQQAAALEELRKQEEALLAAEEKRLALEKQRQDLAFLEEQAKLLDLIKEHGLDAATILGGIELGIDADVSAIVQAMTAAMQAIVEQAEAELGISSPSRVFARIGSQMMAGLEASIASMVPVVQSQIQMAVQPLALPGRSPAPVTSTNEYHYHLTTPSVMRDGGLQMEFASMEMASR